MLWFLIVLVNCVLVGFFALRDRKYWYLLPGVTLVLYATVYFLRSSFADLGTNIVLSWMQKGLFLLMVGALTVFLLRKPRTLDIPLMIGSALLILLCVGRSVYYTYALEQLSALAGDAIWGYHQAMGKIITVLDALREILMILLSVYLHITVKNRIHTEI